MLCPFPRPAPLFAVQGFSLPGPSLAHFIPPLALSALDGLGCFSLSHLPYFLLLLDLCTCDLLYLECSSDQVSTHNYTNSGLSSARRTQFVSNSGAWCKSVLLVSHTQPQWFLQDKLLEVKLSVKRRSEWGT